MKILIKNVEIITQNPGEEILTGDVLVEDTRIAAVGQIEPGTPADKVIDGTGKTLIPGFVQTHIHLCQTLFRGQADDLELMDWLRKRIWPLEASHDEESNYWSALLGIGELIESGTTSLVDMETVHHTESAFNALAESGIRAMSGKVMMDHGAEVPAGLFEDTADSLDQSVQLLKKWHGYDGGRIQYAFCPRFVVSCTEKLLTGVRDLSAYYDVMVHTHASENRGEIALVEAERGMRNVQYLEHIGLANERLILAHSIWLDEQERQILAQRNVKVTHCISSNLKLSSGIADVPGLKEAGIIVGLGADGAACSNNLDMFQEMRIAAMVQKVLHGPTCLPAREVFKMATMGGAQVMRLEKEIGSIEVGKRADLVLMDLNQLHAFPSTGVDPISRLVYSASKRDVETVIINGRVVMENHQLTTIDRAAVLRNSNEAIDRLLKRSGVNAKV
ncbi:MAG: N-ethylammeline chlorohydrolase [Chloroflexi bacterium]|jgi:5-methylthioadenosine/S-adenosylhomocysteine deaminase|nr:N-ethylammeline chlorohydrolase [Chloroflexota bacterium]